jgi:hypothetical protein
MRKPAYHFGKGSVTPKWHHAIGSIRATRAELHRLPQPLQPSGALDQETFGIRTSRIPRYADISPRSVRQRTQTFVNMASRTPSSVRTALCPRSCVTPGSFKPASIAPASIAPAIRNSIVDTHESRAESALVLCGPVDIKLTRHRRVDSDQQENGEGDLVFICFPLLEVKQAA